MKTPLLLISLTLAAGCAAAGTQNSGGDVKAMPGAESRTSSVLPTELSVAHAGLLRAWQGKDPMAMRPYYADDAVIVTRTDRYQGWTELHDRWLAPTLEQLSGFLAMPTSFTRTDDVIHEQGRFSFHLVRDGEEKEVRGVYAQQWKRQENGHWRVTAATLTAD